MEQGTFVGSVRDDGRSVGVPAEQSFFVIFFSFESADGGKRKDLLSSIAVQMQPKGKTTTPGTGTGSGKGSGEGAGGGEGTGAYGVDRLTHAFASLPVQVERMPNEESLIINLPDQIYGPRQFATTGDVAESLERVLEVLKPYRDRIELVFIGHADSLTLGVRNKYLDNNFDLSSLRASRAMSFAVRQGFDPSGIAIGAAASNARNSRSLSLKVSARAAAPAH